MKVYFTLILILSVLFFTTCKKKLTQFYIDYDSAIVIPSSVNSVIPISLLTPEVTTNSNFEFENNNTKADFVETIFLKNLELTISSPNNETFSFLNSVELYISSPTLTEQKIAYKNNIPSNVGNQLICEIENIDLKEFIKAPKFSLRLVSVTDETIPEDIHVSIYSNFFVDAKLRKNKN